MSVPSLSRRTLLASGAGLIATAGIASLAACSSAGGGSKSNNASANTSVVLPTYIPYTGAEPDLPSNEIGVESGYYAYPSNRPSSTSSTPGPGGESLTGMARLYPAAPPGPDKNSWWAGLNQRLGVDLDLSMVPAADYGPKFATTIAGGKLPDMLQMDVVANYPQLLDKRFTPLDEYLSGDAIKDYPNLANVPTFTWKNAIYNGHIYGIPIPLGRVGTYDLIRPGIFDKAGVDKNISGGWDEFVESMKALTSAKQRRWAFARADAAFTMVRRINEVPNEWAEEGGNLTSMYDTEQYRQALEDMISLWKAGVLHPDAFSIQQPWKQLFSSGNISVNPDGYKAWSGYVQSNSDDPKFRQDVMTVSTRDGTKPAPWYPGPGFFATNALSKQSDPEKIKLALRVCDYLAAPFGTEEHYYLNYGTEGEDHTIVDGEPVKTKQGIANLTAPIGFFGAAPHALYQPGRPGDVDIQHGYMSTVLPLSTVNPVLGLFSNTAAADATPANLAILDAINGIIQGRKPISEFAGAVTTWKSAAGEKMRQEYTEQLQSGSEEGPR